MSKKKKTVTRKGTDDDVMRAITTTIDGADKKLFNARAIITSKDDVKDALLLKMCSKAQKDNPEIRAYKEHLEKSIRRSSSEKDERLEKPIEFWTNRQTDYALHELKMSNVTDELILSTKVADELGELWDFKNTKFSEYKGDLVIPSDLCMEGTLPFYDEIIQMEMRDEKHHFASIQRTRVLIKRDSLKDLTAIKDEEYRIIGYLELKFFGNFSLIAAIGVDGRSRERLLVSTDVGAIGQLPKHGYFPEFTIHRIAKTYLAIWYGTCLALLHPNIREKIMTEPVAERHAKPHKGPQQTKKVRYVKTHYLREGDISGNRHHRGRSLNADGSSKYSRHTPYWHVSGHFRMNKETGKRDKFIPGYWKGPERMKVLKGEITPEARERELEVKPTTKESK